MLKAYDSTQDRNFQDLTWILVGVALADRDRIPEIEEIMTDTAKEALPHKQRRILTAIVEGKGEQVWDSLKAIGAEREEDNPTERAIDAVIRTLRKSLYKHVMIVMQRRLVKQSFHDNVEGFAETLQKMLAELPRVEAETTA